MTKTVCLAQRLLVVVCLLIISASSFSQQLSDVIRVDIPLNSTKTAAIEKLKQKGFKLTQRNEDGDSKTFLYIKGGGFYGPSFTMAFTEKNNKVIEISWECNRIDNFRLELEEEINLSAFHSIEEEFIEVYFYHWKGKTLMLVEKSRFPIFFDKPELLENSIARAVLNDMLKTPQMLCLDHVTIISDEYASKIIQKYKEKIIEETMETMKELEEEEIVDQTIYQTVEEMPSFPGGEQKLTEYVAKNLKYPQIARETEIQGRVFVGFIIEHDGSVSNVKLLKGIGGGCDEEAMRVIKSLPKWNPGKQNGKTVRVSYQIPVFFKLQ